jgi:hypothetical protein
MSKIKKNKKIVNIKLPNKKIPCIIKKNKFEDIYYINLNYKKDSNSSLSIVNLY